MGGTLGLDPPRGIQSVTMSQRTFEALRIEIIQGRLRPGQRLVETELVQWLDISRTPLREALHRLESDGWLTRMKAGGYYVAAITREETAYRVEVRAALEGLLARDAAVARTDDDLAEMTAWTEEMERCAERGASDGVAAFGQKVHGRLNDLARNTVAKGILRSLHEQLERTRNQTIAVPGRLEEAAHGHRDILAAIREGDSDSAERAVRTHILQGGQRLLLALDGHVVGEPR